MGAAPAAGGARRRGGRRVRLHRARNIWTAIGVTTACALLPGSGFLVAGRRRLGLMVLVPHLLAAAVLIWYVATHSRDIVRMAVDPNSLAAIACGMLIALVVWIVVLIASYRMLRPESALPWQQALGGTWIALLCLLVALPIGVGARYAQVQRDLINSVFDESDSLTSPDFDEENPWGDDGRINLLLLGGDGGVDRAGIRTDSVMVASINTRNGKTVLFSLPRNLAEVPFKKGTPLDELYPEGFTGDGDELEWVLNAVYRNVPAMHPQVLGAGSDNEGADALKLAVSGALGLNVDYYMLINLNGFEQVVDAIGGVTVNINEPIPIGGNTDQNIPPDDYLDPGPNRHLDGFEALWFARGRWGFDDYHRMRRQRCMMDAIIEKADPGTVLRRYEKLASAGKEILRTDIPQELLPDLVDLAGEIQGAKVTSVVFERSDNFSPSDPDYDWVHRQVKRAIGIGGKGKPGKPTSSATANPNGGPTGDASPDEPTESSGTDVEPDDKDSCAYEPVSEES
jgi:LCP family protein required for cell wall assembly